MTSARCRLIAHEICVDFKVSQRRASRVLDLARSNLRYTPVVGDEQAALARRIEELAGLHPRYGYRRIWALLDREGWSVIKKMVRRHWRRLGLKLANPWAKPKPRRPHGQDANACHLRPSLGKDDVWTWDFLFDRTSNGRSLKWLSLIDEYTRECLVLEARPSMTAEEIRVISIDGRDGRFIEVIDDEIASQIVRGACVAKAICKGICVKRRFVPPTLR
jgi:transposase InsO family protein